MSIKDRGFTDKGNKNVTKILFKRVISVKNVSLTNIKIKKRLKRVQ